MLFLTIIPNHSDKIVTEKDSRLFESHLGEVERFTFSRTEDCFLQ